MKIEEQTQAKTCTSTKRKVDMVIVGQTWFKKSNIFRGDRTKHTDSLPEDEAHTVTNNTNVGTLSETTNLSYYFLISGYIFIFSAANFPKMLSKWHKRKKHSAPAFAQD